MLIQISPRMASLFVCKDEKRKKQPTEKFVNCSLAPAESDCLAKKMLVER
jgi:hypothetical protein